MANTKENRKQYMISGFVNTIFIKNLSPLLKITNKVRNNRTRLSREASNCDIL